MLRRRLLAGTAAGLGAGLLAGLDAALADENDNGVPVPPNPLASIQPSGVAVELVDFAAPPRSSSSRPYANLNFLYHAGDGRPYLYANDARGKIWRIHATTGAVSLFLDLKKSRGAAFIFTGSQTGLRSFAFHPNFANGGMAGYRKYYTISTETIASRPANAIVLSGVYPAIHDFVLAEWTVDGSNPPKAYTTARREILRIPVWRSDHGADQLMFNPAAVPGSAEFGKLYITVGDGGNNLPYADPYEQAQDLTAPLGKVYRINPLKSSTSAFRRPSDNPWAGGTGCAPVVWARGLRHPQNLSFDPLTGTGILTDIGQMQIEEVNLLARGANYGWPLREGTFTLVRDEPDQLYGLPATDATLGLTYPVAQYSHQEGMVRADGTSLGFHSAICGGFVYRGTSVPALYGHYLCGELVNGRIFHVPLANLVRGQQATLKELTLLRNGSPVTLAGLAAATSGRADLRFGQGADGEVYILTKQDGMIRRMAAPATV